MTPNDVCVIIPGTCEYVPLHGKKDFISVIKVTDSERRRVAWIIQGEPKWITGIRTGRGPFQILENQRDGSLGKM